MNDTPKTAETAVADPVVPCVLVVDDDDTTRVLARAHLEASGFAVAELSSGADLLATARTLQPQAIILDIIMPGMDGFAACTALRGQAETGDTPILIMTALDDTASIEKAFQAGATEFATKPVNWASEVHRLRFMLRAAADIRANRALEKQLLHAQKLEAVGTLAAGLAHEFNNILQVIVGNVCYLLDDESATDTESLEEIRQAAERGRQLTQQLLTASRKIREDRVPLSLNSCLEEHAKLMTHTLPRGVQLVLELAPELRPVRAAARQVEQVLMNLTVNAAHAMGGNGRLRLCTANVDLDAAHCALHPGATPGEYVQLRVADTGHGMAPDVLQHIFEPFFTTKPVGEGSGLGLSVVYNLVKRHGGHITCDSTPGQGTVFRIYLPACADAPLPSVPERPVETSIPGGGGKGILVVDDEPGVLRVVERILTKEGYRTVTATDGVAALEIYQTQWQDLAAVILDLNMPRMGGVECLPRLCAINPAARILVATGRPDCLNCEPQLQAHISAFVGKPYDTNELLRVLHQVLTQEPTTIAVHPSGDVAG